MGHASYTFGKGQVKKVIQELREVGEKKRSTKREGQQPAGHRDPVPAEGPVVGAGGAELEEQLGEMVESKAEDLGADKRMVKTKTGLEPKGAEVKDLLAAEELGKKGLRGKCRASSPRLA